MHLLSDLEKEIGNIYRISQPQTKLLRLRLINGKGEFSMDFSSKVTLCRVNKLLKLLLRQVLNSKVVYKPVENDDAPKRSGRKNYDKHINFFPLNN